MDLKKVQQEINENKAILIDVREQEEWDEGHLACARLIPLSQLSESDIPKDLPKDKTIYLHCRKGGRAAQACEILKKNLYSNACALNASFDELQKIFPLS